MDATTAKSLKLDYSDFCNFTAIVNLTTYLCCPLDEFKSKFIDDYGANAAIAKDLLLILESEKVAYLESLNLPTPLNIARWDATNKAIALIREKLDFVRAYILVVAKMQQNVNKFNQE